MATIAIICEGVSEFNILEHIISKFCGTNHLLNPIQPRITGSHTQESDGGWAEVLSHCNDKVFNEIFQFNDYLVIQIDTDSSYIKPYSVSHHFITGIPKSDKRLHAEIKARLLSEISRPLRRKFLSKIIFAICHNEIECWLLPLFYYDNRACKTNNCIKILNKALSKKNMDGIPDKGKNSDQARKAYKDIFKLMKKKERIIEISTCSNGFNSFLKGLDTIN